MHLKNYKRVAAGGHWAYRSTVTGRFVTPSTWRRSQAQHKRVEGTPAKRVPTRREYQPPTRKAPRGKTRETLSRQFALAATLAPQAAEQIAARDRKLDLDDPWEKHLAKDQPLIVTVYDRALTGWESKFYRDKNGRPHRRSNNRIISESTVKRSMTQRLRTEKIRVYAELNGQTTAQVRFALLNEFLLWDELDAEIKKSRTL